jgi:hypothetical protein
MGAYGVQNMNVQIQDPHFQPPPPNMNYNMQPGIFVGVPVQPPADSQK